MNEEMGRPEPASRKAIYKGVKILINSMDEDYYYVVAMGKRLPAGFFVDMHMTGLAEYWGKIPRNSGDIELVE